MKSKRIIIGISFLVLLLVCILPPLIYGYIYPNEGEDTANNIMVITQMCNGTLPDFQFRYVGYAMLGYPLYYFAELIHVDFPNVFNWFHLLLPLIIGVCLFFIFTKLFNWIVGLLSLVIPIFVSGASVYYIYFGNLYSLISITILYPLLFYFASKWFVERKNHQLIGMIITSIITGLFHVSGLYLPVVACFALVVYLIYAKVTKQQINKLPIVVGIGIVLIGVVLILAVPYTRNQIVDVFHGINGGMVLTTEKSLLLNEVYKSIVPFQYFVKNFVSILIVIMLAIGLWKIKEIKTKLSKQSMIFLILLTCLALILVVVAYFRLSTVPFRQQTDLAIIVALIVMVLVGGLILINKRFLIAIGILAVIGLYPQFLPHWFENNSAIKPSDKQAIEYINSLNVKTYDCSSQVSYLLYDIYLDAKYDWHGDYADILIMRNEPMTQGNDVNSVYYDGHGKTSTSGYQLDKVFDDGIVKVEVFKKN